MLVTLTELAGESKRFDLDWLPERLNELIDDSGDGAIRFTEPVVGRLEITPLDGDYGLTGHVKTGLEYVCDRCLDEQFENIDLEFSAVLVTVAEYSAAERELTEDDLDTIEVTDGVLDLEQAVLEQILLTRPMVALCRDDCRGLCPKCGKNLNLGGCGCPEKEIDPRLAGLAKLKIVPGDKEK